MSASRSRPRPVAAWHPLDPGGAIPLGRAVRDARRRRALTQGALAATLGVARDTVSCLERGNRTNPRLRLLADLAPALGVSVASFVEAYLGPAATPHDLVDVRATVAHHAEAPANLHERGSLRTTGPRGMGVALRTFRVDLGAGVEGTALRARTQRRHLERASRTAAFRAPGCCQ